ncbi:MAG: N-acetylmuramoyl-L-alanine amidase [Cyclobacteriaceae bacterium]
MISFSFIRWLLIGIVVGLVTCKTAPPSVSIQSRPIIFNEQRKALSLDYMREHYGMNPTTPTITPRMIVVHWTAIPTLEGSFEAFYEPTLPASRAKIGKASALNVSVPYLIDRDGTIYQLMADSLFARHVIGLNYCAIGIENVGDGGQNPLTEAQLSANEQLIRYLMDKYAIDYVIGHHEYQQFIGHPLWKEQDAAYLTEKDDPGDAFMQQLRTRLSDLDLTPLPHTNSIHQGITGQVRWYEGNLMPTIVKDTANDQSHKGEAVQRTLQIYELTQQDQATEQSGFFHDLQTKQVATVATDAEGRFQLALPPGQYSLLVEEEQGLFANRFDGEGHIAPITVQTDSVTRIDIKIDYKAVY